MPLITRVYIKAALIYLAAALLISVLPELPNAPRILSAFRPVQIHLFLVGWVTQLIFGVVIWMFPKFSMQKPRGNEKAAWASLILLNAGLILRAIGEPLHAELSGSLWGGALAASALLQWLAGMILVAYTWPRVKER